MTILHNAYGLTWKVPWRLALWPVVTEARDVGQGGTIDITVGADPGLPRHARRVGAFRAVAHDALWLDVPEAGTFAINGMQVVFHPWPECDVAVRDLVLTGPVAGIVLRHVGLVPLHGAAVTHPLRGTAVVVGQASVGVSTLAGTMVYRGFDLIGDELIALLPRPGQRPLVLGGQTALQLPPDAAALLSKTLKDQAQRLDQIVEPISGGEQGGDAASKPRLRLAVQSASGAYEVDTIVQLTDDSDEIPKLEPVRGLARMSLIQAGDWQRHMRTVQGYTSDDFVTAGTVARHVDMKILRRVDTRTIHVGQLARLLARHTAAVHRHTAPTVASR